MSCWINKQQVEELRSWGNCGAGCFCLYRPSNYWVTESPRRVLCSQCNDSVQKLHLNAERNWIDNNQAMTLLSKSWLFYFYLFSQGIFFAARFIGFKNTYTQFRAARSRCTRRLRCKYWTPLAACSAISTTSWVVRALGGPSLLTLHLPVGPRNFFIFL